MPSLFVTTVDVEVEVEVLSVGLIDSLICCTFDDLSFDDVSIRCLGLLGGAA